VRTLWKRFLGTSPAPAPDGCASGPHILARDFVNAATLGAYVLLRLGLARELDDATRRLVDEFGKSDVYVLRGEAVAATKGLDAARDHLVIAAEVGAPSSAKG